MSRKKKSEQDQIPFGKILKKIMAERGLTLKQVGEMAGVSGSVVSDWCASTHPSNLKAVGRLAKGLGISLSSLLLGEPEEVRTIASIHELFEESEIFDGLCRISIKKVALRQKI